MVDILNCRSQGAQSDTEIQILRQIPFVYFSIRLDLLKTRGGMRTSSLAVQVIFVLLGQFRKILKTFLVLRY
jgi:hypothetical protein